MIPAKQNQKFPFHFLPAPPTPPAEEKKKGKENFWFLLPRPKGAGEARRLVVSRISLEKSSDFVQETQPKNRIAVSARIRSVAKRRDGGFYNHNIIKIFVLRANQEANNYQYLT